jgi:hypothetical protein
VEEVIGTCGIGRRCLVMENNVDIDTSIMNVKNEI